ncbi:ATP dependent DNA ligase domain-containing protein [Choanephora cucurbitarum]|nr:ATP dependent DNA ligase domain-containing protein [Choanephora cucurbitarum]
MSTSSSLFSNFCEFLDRLEQAKTNEKKRLIRNYIQKWVANFGTNVYEVVRLLLPKADELRMYQLKEDRLATVLLKALGIGPQSTDGIRLKKYKIPSAHNQSAGNFPLIAYEEIKKRSSVRHSTKTMRETNDYLDQLANREKTEDQVAIFKDILDQYTPEQIQWIIRMILKDLKIHSGEKLILDAIHEDMYQQWMINKDLFSLCQLGDRTVEDGTRRKGIHLFERLVPQTAERYTDKLLDQMAKPFYIEKKYDGERVLMHYDRDKDQFLWHSRKRVIENDLYGSSSKDTTKLAGHIHAGIKAKKVILDGEMLAYDPMEHKFLPFGTLKDASKSRNINNPTEPHPCFLVFDILLFNDTPLVNNRLEDRLKVLKTVMTEQQMHLRFVTRKEVNTREEVNGALEEALLNHEEGIVIKDRMSLYRIGRRSPQWLKYKPIYFDSLVDTCDLVVVGAKHGRGTRGGQGRFASIMCAVRDDRIPSTDPPKFVTLTLAGGGLNQQIMRELLELMKTTSPHDPRRPPDWLVHPTKGGESFDQIVDYRDNIIVEVKGVEIVDSTKFGLQSTLRFPVLKGFRHDKGWQDIMTYSDVIKAKAEGAVGKKRAQDDRMTEQIKDRKKKRRAGTVLLASQLGADSSQVVQSSTIFENTKFFVITGTKLNPHEPEGILKDELDLMIKEHGGNYVQNKNADVLIAGIQNSRVQSIIQCVKDKDILLPSYILDSIDAGKRLPLQPKYMLYTSPETARLFAKSMDIYGDSYTKPIKADDLEETMQRMQPTAEYDEADRRDLALQLQERYFPEGLHGMIFVRSVAYFDFDSSMPSSQPVPVHMAWVEWKRRQERLVLAKHRFEFEAGQATEDLQDQRITHVIVSHPDRLAVLTEAFVDRPLPRFVVTDWIDRCFEEDVFMDETAFHPNHIVNN